MCTKSLLLKVYDPDSHLKSTNTGGAFEDDEDLVHAGIGVGGEDQLFGSAVDAAEFHYFLGLSAVD